MSPRISNLIVEEITIDAAAERVFAVLVSPEERVKWWGGEGSFQTTHMSERGKP